MKPALLEGHHHNSDNPAKTPATLSRISSSYSKLVGSTHQSKYFHISRGLNFLLLFVYLSSLLISPSEAQSPCSLQSQCFGGCCELLEVNNILGYYCQSLGQCNKSHQGIASLKKEEGGSCSRTNECSSNCCEGGVCREHDYCYSSYLEPFIIILVIVLLIIIGVVLFFVIRACTRKKKLKKKQQEKEQQQNPKGLRDHEQSLVRNEKDSGYQSPRHPLQNGVNGSETRGPRQI